ncbi:MAG: cupin domain-containing protein [Sedimenticolaceae bacterium]|nr:cupin domain-containing protein [Sedimenticolaceae bacterium]
MKSPRILRRNDQETLIPEGCYISELSNSDADPDLSIAQARVPPGVTTEWHRLSGTDERYLILEGEGIVEVEGLPATRVRDHDVVLIPAGSRQRITNSSKSADLRFLALCTPAFREENYVLAEQDEA